MLTGVAQKLPEAAVTLVKTFVNSGTAGAVATTAVAATAGVSVMATGTITNAAQQKYIPFNPDDQRAGP